MKASKSLQLVGILVALFAAGNFLAYALASPLPAPLVGLGFMLFGLRVGVMASATHDAPEAAAPRIARGAHARQPALHAANG